MVTKIYFCHPVSDYNDEFETECIKKIEDEFGDEFGDIEIINPRNIKIDDSDKKKLSGSLDDYIEMMEKYFFPEIDRCDIIYVFASDYQKYTDGVIREIQYARKRGKTVIELWQKDRISFYHKSGVLNFIENFFDVKKGIRCVVGHEKDMYRLKHEPSYRLWENGKCRGYTLPDPISRKYDILRDYWCVHSLMYTFDKSVLTWNDASNSKSMFRDRRVGLNAVIELDSPDDPSSDKAKRLTFFDHIAEFDSVISKIDKILENETTEYNLMFSGNGIYVMLEGYYGEDLLEEGCFKQNFSNLLDTLKEKEGLGDKMRVHVDNAKAPWNDYFKICFTFHETRPRISIPLPKGKLDGKWIDKVSNVNNVMNDYSIIDEIIKKAEWKKIW